MLTMAFESGPSQLELFGRLLNGLLVRLVGLSLHLGLGGVRHAELQSGSGR